MRVEQKEFVHMGKVENLWFELFDDDDKFLGTVHTNNGLWGFRICTTERAMCTNLNGSSALKTVNTSYWRGGLYEEPQAAINEFVRIYHPGWSLKDYEANCNPIEM